MNRILLGMLGVVLMASSAQSQPAPMAFDTWVAGAFLNQPVSEPPPSAGLQVVRQDYGEFMLRQAVMKTPLKIGQTNYTHGLGTHAVSEIVVRLDRPAQRFTAAAGVDNNYDTAGVHGSVIFAVDVGGKDAFKSELHRGGQAPLPVDVDLNGATQFTLRAFDGGDGPAWDQCDWADAAVVYADGSKTWLDEMKVVLAPVKLGQSVPFSFEFDGKSSREFLDKWQREERSEPVTNGRMRSSVTWTDPTTGLKVICELTRFSGTTAADWVLYFHNGGTADSGILSNIRPLDLAATVPPKDGEVVLHRANGSTCATTDFLPIDEKLDANADVQFAPSGGRSSDGVLPFFNVQWAGGGVVAAIGWSGQWSARVHRDAGSGLILQAGQQFAKFKLHQGERVRTPRILLGQYDGADRIAGNNLLRRVMLDHYVPRIDGQIVVPPVTHNTWFVFNSGNDVTEQNQLECIKAMARTGVEYYWLDAGWFEGGWPAGAGSWVPKKDAFPRGLKPVGDAAHAAGMKFVLWFEPERVTPASQIAKEHPEWVLHAGDGDGLFNLGDNFARSWLTDHLSRCIADWGVDIYRNDFNIDPLRFWQKADAPDRQGIAEIRYIEGLYTMWDDLRERRPGLFIDNCASGGRRIDLETMSRSIPLWQSDTSAAITTPRPTPDQVQSAGLSLWVPLHSGGVWSFEPYGYRSLATTGLNIGKDPRAADYPVEAVNRMIAEVKRLRPLWLGDFYPLLPINLDERHWMAWQLHRTDLGKGFIMLFRRDQSPYSEVEIAPQGLDAHVRYKLTFTDRGEERTLSADAFKHLQVTIPAAPGCELIEYEAIK